MIPSLRKWPLLPLAAAAALAVSPGFSAPDRVIAPIAHNWSVPLFSPQGFRTMTMGGSEMRPIDDNRIDVVDMNILVFSGDAAARVDTIIRSPFATFLHAESIARGSGPVSLIRDDLEVAGEDWTYFELEKRVLLNRHVRVKFQAAMPDILK